MSGTRQSIELEIAEVRYIKALGKLINTVQTKITIIFTPKMIFTSFVSEDGMTNHCIEINCSEIPMYFYDVRDNDNEILEEFCATFKTGDLSSIISNSPVKNCLKACMERGGDKFFVDIDDKNSAGNGGALTIPMLSGEIKNVEMDLDYENYPLNPNVKILSPDLSSIYKKSSGLHPHTCEVECRPHSMSFSLYKADSTFAGCFPIVDRKRPGSYIRNYDNMPPGEKFLEVFKSSNVINQICLKGTSYTCIPFLASVSHADKLVSFYFKEDGPILAETSIGSFGIYTVSMLGI